MKIRTLTGTVACSMALLAGGAAVAGSPAVSYEQLNLRESAPGLTVADAMPPAETVQAARQGQLPMDGRVSEASQPATATLGAGPAPQGDGWTSASTGELNPPRF